MSKYLEWSKDTIIQVKKAIESKGKVKYGRYGIYLNRKELKIFLKRLQDEVAYLDGKTQ